MEAGRKGGTPLEAGSEGETPLEAGPPTGQEVCDWTARLELVAGNLGLGLRLVALKLGLKLRFGLVCGKLGLLGLWAAETAGDVGSHDDHISFCGLHWTL